MTQDADTTTPEVLSASEYSDEQKEKPMIIGRQKVLLTQLVYQNVHDPSQVETWIASLDDMTRAEESETISSFIGTK